MLSYGLDEQKNKANCRLIDQAKALIIKFLSYALCVDLGSE